MLSDPLKRGLRLLEAEQVAVLKLPLIGSLK